LQLFLHFILLKCDLCIVHLPRQQPLGGVLGLGFHSAVVWLISGCHLSTKLKSPLLKCQTFLILKHLKGRRPKQTLSHGYIENQTVKNVAYVDVTQHQGHCRRSVPPPLPPPLVLARKPNRENTELQKTPLDASHQLNNTNPPAHNTAPLGSRNGSKVNTTRPGSGAKSNSLLTAHNVLRLTQHKYLYVDLYSRHGYTHLTYLGPFSFMLVKVAYDV